MGVTAQIAEHILGASEGSFRGDHPVFSEQWSQPGSKDFGLSEKLQVSMKVELAVLEGAFESLVELAAEDATQYLDGKKEVVACRSNALVFTGLATWPSMPSERPHTCERPDT